MNLVALLPLRKVWLMHHDAENKPIDILDALKSLDTDVPAWRVGSDGTLLAANALALWMWEVPLHEEEPTEQVNVFDIFARNFDRVPVGLNADFWEAKLRIERAIDAEKSAFEGILRRSIEFRDLSLQVTGSPPRPVWRYMLSIRDPETSASSPSFLRFITTVKAVSVDGDTPGGYLARYVPVTAVEAFRLKSLVLPRAESRNPSVFLFPSRQMVDVRAISRDLERRRASSRRLRVMLSERRVRSTMSRVLALELDEPEPPRRIEIITLAMTFGMMVFLLVADSVRDGFSVAIWLVTSIATAFILLVLGVRAHRKMSI